MRKSLTISLIVLAVLTISIVIAKGILSMSAEPTVLNWEWPAGRPVETKLLVQIQSISKASGGFLGIRRSPSLADSLPDATEVAAAVVSGPEDFKAKTVSVRVPGMEAKTLKIGQHAALGLISGNAVCICIIGAPANNPDEVRSWFMETACQERR